MKFWRKTGRKTGTLNTRFAANSTLTVAVAGTVYKLLGIKIYHGELTNDDYELFFLENVQKLQACGINSIAWVHDNARWHLLNNLSGKLGTICLINTVPHFFQTNLLEFLFSSVRRNFRKRPLCATEEKELSSIVKCFTESNRPRVLAAARYRIAHHIGMLLEKVKITIKCKVTQKHK